MSDRNTASAIVPDTNTAEGNPSDTNTASTLLASVRHEETLASTSDTPVFRPDIVSDVKGDSPSLLVDRTVTQSDIVSDKNGGHARGRLHPISCMTLMRQATARRCPTA